MAKVTFSTTCMKVKTVMTVDFDLSKLSDADILAYALRSIIIDFQNGIRETMTSAEAFAMFNDKVIIVEQPGTRKAKVKTLATRAWEKHQKGETLTREETQALLDSLTKVKPVEPAEEESEFIITKD